MSILSRVTLHRCWHCRAQLRLWIPSGAPPHLIVWGYSEGPANRKRVLYTHCKRVLLENLRTGSQPPGCSLFVAGPFAKPLNLVVCCWGCLVLTRPPCAHALAPSDVQMPQPRHPVFWRLEQGAVSFSCFHKVTLGHCLLGLMTDLASTSFACGSNL